MIIIHTVYFHYLKKYFFHHFEIVSNKNNQFYLQRDSLNF